jgi:hypothetical protein
MFCVKAGTHNKIFVLYDCLVHTLRLILSDYKQIIKNLVFFSRQMEDDQNDEFGGYTSASVINTHVT